MGTYGIIAPVSGASLRRDVTPTQWKVFIGTYLAWVLDAFDFTILTFLLIDIQQSFTVDKALAGALGTVTLIFRVAGGIGTGTAADRWGRKRPLMFSVLWYSLFSFLSGFSTSYAMLFVLRGLFGIGMGGVWAAGMPLALEHWPARLRGTASGMMQSGYSMGFSWPRSSTNSSTRWSATPAIWAGGSCSGLAYSPPSWCSS
jgi:SHS family lactate transporter-like MFS transporter